MIMRHWPAKNVTVENKSISFIDLIVTAMEMLRQ